MNHKIITFFVDFSRNISNRIILHACPIEWQIKEISKEKKLKWFKLIFKSWNFWKECMLTHTINGKCKSLTINDVIHSSAQKIGQIEVDIILNKNNYSFFGFHVIIYLFKYTFVILLILIYQDFVNNLQQLKLF